MQAGLDGLDGFTIEDEAGRRIEACQSPVWDTALAVVALADAGVSPEDPVLRTSRTVAVGRGDHGPGGLDRAAARSDAGGLGLRVRQRQLPRHRRHGGSGARSPTDRTSPTTGRWRRAVAWTEGMQCRDGGWAAFDVDNTRALCRELPFCDFGELIDPPSADVTAHVIEMLSILGHNGRATRARDRLVARGPRGGRIVVRPLGGELPLRNRRRRAGAGRGGRIAADHPAMRRAVAWIESHQNDDGGWGEDLRSYRDADYGGAASPMPCQTAWALLALLAAGERGPVAERGVAFLVDTQRADGTWDETWFTGTGFPGDFYINYHLYHLVFPVMALGRLRPGVGSWLISRRLTAERRRGRGHRRRRHDRRRGAWSRRVGPAPA